MNSECGDCGFSAGSVVDRGCTCFPNNPTQITVHAVIEGTPTKNVSELVGVVENWVQSGAVVMDVQNYSLSRDAVVDIALANGACVPVDDTPLVTTVTVQDDETDFTTTDPMTTTGGACNTVSCSLCYISIVTLVLLAILLEH